MHIVKTKTNKNTARSNHLFQNSEIALKSVLLELVIKNKTLQKLIRNFIKLNKEKIMQKQINYQN